MLSGYCTSRKEEKGKGLLSLRVESYGEDLGN
jgi:hypothetical protein